MLHPALFLVMKNIPHREWSCAIDGMRRVIGRSRDAAIVVPARFTRVSRRHAEVWTDRYGAWIHDLESQAGTCINGVWVDHVPRAGIVAHDTIRIGDAELEVVEQVTELAKPGSMRDDGEDTERPPAPAPSGREMCKRLSPAEIDVLLWLSRGYESDVELGRLLHRSPSTIHTEVISVFTKLGLHSRAELMGWLKRSNSTLHASHIAGGGGPDCVVDDSRHERIGLVARQV